MTEASSASWSCELGSSRKGKLGLLSGKGSAPINLPSWRSACSKSSPCLRNPWWLWAVAKEQEGHAESQPSLGPQHCHRLTSMESCGCVVSSGLCWAAREV